MAGFWDNNYINSWKQNKALRDADGIVKGSDAWNGYNAAMQASAGGAALSAVQGITGILNPTLQMAQAPDVSMYQNQIDQLGNFRDGKTWDINQLMENRSSVINPRQYTYEDIGGITDAGIAGGTLSSALSGASAGLSIGGLPGLIIGGVLGAGAGLIGGFTGRDAAKREVEGLNMSARYEAKENEKYFNTQADRIQDFQYDNLFAHRAAQGGSIHIKKANRGKFTEAAKRHHMTVQQFAKHVLSNKNKSKYSATMRKRANFARNAAGWSHAEGGQLDNSLTMESYNSHGGYYSPNNLVRINTGGTHEQNPNGGVQYGMDAQGIPNLVEQEENIYKKGGEIGNDYVFSDRLKATRSELKKFGLPEAYAGKSFSEIADVLSEEAKDRPNDAVSNNGMGAMLDRLMACQEDHKQRQEQAELRRELSRLSPEELAELETMLAQQEQAPVQEQPQVPVMEQPQPEMAAAPQEQVPAQLPEQMAQMPVVAAYGGPIRVLGTGTPGLLLDPNATLPDEYVPEDGTTRAMQHFDERQDRNKAIAEGIDYFFNGPDDVFGGAGAIELLAGPAAVAKVGKVAKGVSKAIKVAEKGKKLKAIEAARDVAKAEATAAAGKANAAGKEAEKLLAKATKFNEKGKYEEATELLGRAKTALNTQKVETSAYKAAAKNASRRHPRINTTVPVTTEAAEGAAATATSAPTWWQRNRGWVIPTAAIGGATSLGIPAGMAIWGGKGKESKRPADAAVGTYSSSDIQEGGRFGVSGYNAYGGPVYREYSGKNGSVIGKGPIYTAMTTAPEYENTYSYFTNNPLYVGSGVEWVRHPSGAATQDYGTSYTYETPPEYYLGPEPRTTSGSVTAGSTGSGSSAGSSSEYAGSAAAASGSRADAPVVVNSTPVDGTKLVSDANLAIERANNDFIRGIEAGLSEQEAAYLASVTPDKFSFDTTITVPRKTKATGPAPLASPQWLIPMTEYGTALFNAFQQPDRLNLTPLKPTFVNGRLALERQRYTPIDQQTAINPVLSNSAAYYRGISNAGMGLSMPASLAAAIQASNQGIGAATAQGRLYNDQLRSNVIQQNNAAEQTEADFYRGINTTNAQIANQMALQNYYGNMRQQMYNNEQETAKWNAVSGAYDAANKGVADLLHQNAVMNQVNSNRALLGYWVDANGWAHYTRQDGSQVVMDRKTGQILGETPATLPVMSIQSPSYLPVSDEKKKQIQAETAARIAAMRKKYE